MLLLLLVESNTAWKGVEADHMLGPRSPEALGALAQGFIEQLTGLLATSEDKSIAATCELLWKLRRGEASSGEQVGSL